MAEFERVAGDVWLLKVPHPGVWTGVTLVESGRMRILVEHVGGALPEKMFLPMHTVAALQAAQKERK